MNAPFKKQSNEVLDILPIEIDEEEVVDEVVDAPILEEADVFIDKPPSKIKKNITLNLNDENIQRQIAEEEKVVEYQNPIKKTPGERGKDKKPRKKRPPMSDATREKLAAARVISLANRKLLVEERKRIKEQVNQQAKLNVMARLPPKIPKTPATSPVDQLHLKKLQDENESQFFNLLDKWDSGRQLKKQARKKASNQAHPAGRTIEKKHLPVAPPNPFDSIFKYRGDTRSTYW